MYDGHIELVQNIQAGDLLMGPDSRPRLVLSTCSGVEDLYKITPNKGDPYIVNESHILSLIDTRTSSRKLVNISVRDFLKTSEKFQHRAKGWRTGVDFPEHLERPVLAPYFLGIWLGDGTSSCPEITNPDREIIDYVHAYTRSLGMTVRQREQREGHCPKFYLRGNGWRNNIVLNELRKQGLTVRKHIPHRYKTGSRQERLELLAGILDTDGHLSANESGHQKFDLVLKSEELMNDVIFVARSLGFAAYKKECKKACTNSANGRVTGTYYRCLVQGPLDQIPTRVPRKRAKPKSTRNRSHLVTGISLEKQGEGEYFGFELARRLGCANRAAGSRRTDHDATGFGCPKAASAT
jgi:homing endonuclease-like protein